MMMPIRITCLLTPHLDLLESVENIVEIFIIIILIYWLKLNMPKRLRSRDIHYSLSLSIKMSIGHTALPMRLYA